jgi:hypothetical protein
MTLVDQDMTGPRFDELDFCEAFVAVRFVDELPADFRFHVWGTNFFPNRYPVTTGGLPLPAVGADRAASVYLADWAVATFRQVAAVRIKLALYEPTVDGLPRGFLRNGSQIRRLEREWRVGPASGRGREYLLECVLLHPFSALQLTVVSDGPVSLRFAPERLVPFDEVARDFEKYRPDLWGPR